MSEKTVPVLRFKGFSGDWERKKLGEVVDVCSGNDYKHLSNGVIPVYGTGGYMLSVNKALSYNHDAVGIGRKGTIDNPYILKAPFWTVDTLFYAVPRKKIELQFIYSVFLRINWTEKDESTSIPSLSKETINSVIASIPDFLEQTRIGGFFRSLDALISLRQQKHDKLVTVKKAMLSKMFPQDGETVPELRFAGFSGDWERKRLGEMGETFTGLSGKTKNDFGHGNGKYITYMNVFSNPVTSTYITEPIEIDQNQSLVKKGDVFFTTSSETPEEVGMSSVLLEQSDNTYLNSFCFGYRPTEEFDNYYLAYMLRSDEVRVNIVFLAQGISRYNISKVKMMDITIPVPTLPEQARIGNFFQNLDSLISLQGKELEKLNAIKKSLLDKMFV